jgi:hypothetical protein
MAENAPGFEGGTEKGILPKNTTPLTNRLVRNGLVGTVTGAAPGVATSVVKSRRKHPTNVNEEIGAVESETLINRNSAANDVTALKSKFTKKKPSFAFPKDLSGNGGPAFTRS